MTAKTDSLNQTALAYIGERYPEWIARYRTNDDHSGPQPGDSINMLCLLEDAAEEIAALKAQAAKHAYASSTYQLIDLTLANRHGGPSTLPAPTFGEVVAPGLAITPGLAGDDVPRFDGGWNLTHVGSGTRISGGRTLHCLGCVRDYAAAAIRSGIDWTLPQPEITELINARGEQVEGLFDALRELRTCLGTQCDRGIDFGNMPGF